METMIRRDEWLAALKEPEPDTTDGITIQEFMGITGVGRDASLRQMKRLMALGKAEVVGTKRVQDTAGRWQRVPAYRLVKG